MMNIYQSYHPCNNERQWSGRFFFAIEFSIKQMLGLYWEQGNDNAK